MIGLVVGDLDRIVSHVDPNCLGIVQNIISVKKYYKMKFREK